MRTGADSFRRWLLDRIKETRFSLRRNEPIEELARAMGVTAEVLQEAQAEKTEELAQLGRRFIGKKWVADTDYRKLSLWCPGPIRADIADRAARMEISSAELVRSVVQTLLSGPDNPVALLPHWLYRGAIWHHDKRDRNDVRVLLSDGASVALRRRAQRFSVPTLTLVRAAVVDYLEGRMPSAYFVSSREMWEDPNRYWTGELTRKGEYRGHAGTLDP